MPSPRRADQLDLALPDGDGRSRLPQRIRPMRPGAAAGPFDDPDYLFEPWWPGARLLVFVEGGRTRLQVEHLGDASEAFPELAGIAPLVSGDAFVLDGTLLLLDAEGRPDPDALRHRLDRSAAGVGQPGFVAQDVLFADGRTLQRRPYAQRRDTLRTRLRETDWCVVGRAYPGEGVTVAAALEEIGIAAMSARMLTAPYRAGDAGEAWLRIPLEEAAEPPRRPSLALIQRLPLEVDS